MTMWAALKSDTRMSMNSCQSISMQSGIVNGSAAMIDGLLERIEGELGETVSAVAAGDWAETIIPHCRRKDIVIDNDILMHGLWDIYKKNRRNY